MLFVADLVSSSGKAVQIVFYASGFSSSLGHGVVSEDARNKKPFMIWRLLYVIGCCLSTRFSTGLHVGGGCISK